MRVFLLLLALALPVLGTEEVSGVRDLEVEAEQGPPAKLRLRGKAEVADGVILTLSLKHEGTNTHGTLTRQRERLKERVRGGAFDRTFSLPGGLPAGLYRLEVGCDKAHQHAGVALPEGDVRGEVSFKVDFTEDFTARAESLAALHASLKSLWEELDSTYRSLFPRAKDPEAIRDWQRFRKGFDPRMAEAAAKCPLAEEALFPDLYCLLSLVSDKNRAWERDFESLIVLGGLSEERKAEHDLHPEWFEREPSWDLDRAPQFLAMEFTFNSGKRVVEYAYDKATGLIGGLKGAPPDPAAVRRWEKFEAWFSRDLDRISTASSDLSAGPYKAAFRRIAPDVPDLLKAARALLAAGDLMMVDPVEGSAALEAVKAPLRKAYLSIQLRIQEDPTLLFYQAFAASVVDKVDHGYDTAAGILSGIKDVSPDKAEYKAAARRWEAFRADYVEAKDVGLKDLEKQYLGLSGGSGKEFFLKSAGELSALFQSAHAFLEAGDRMVRDPKGGSAAFAALKEPLKKACQTVRRKIQVALCVLEESDGNGAP